LSLICRTGSSNLSFPSLSRPILSYVGCRTHRSRTEATKGLVRVRAVANQATKGFSTKSPQIFVRQQHNATHPRYIYMSACVRTASTLATFRRQLKGPFTHTLQCTLLFFREQRENVRRRGVIPAPGISSYHIISYHKHICKAP